MKTNRLKLLILIVSLLVALSTVTVHAVDNPLHGLVETVEWSPDGSILAIGGSEDIPAISGGIAWSPDGETLAIATSQGVWLHNASNLIPIRQLSEQTSITSLDWQPQGNLIISAGNTIQILDATTTQLILEISQPTVVSISWSPDGNIFAWSTLDGFIRIWDIENEEMLQEIEPYNRGFLSPVTWNVNSSQLATAARGDREMIVGIWDIETGELAQSWSYDRGASTIEWSPDGLTIVAGGSDGHIRIWDPSIGELQYTLDADPNYVANLTWSPDSRRLASIGATDFNDGIARQGMLRIWDMTTAHLITEFAGGILAGNANYTDALAWSPDGSQLAGVSDDGKVYVWDMETYEQIAVYEAYRSLIQSN